MVSSGVRPSGSGVTLVRRGGPKAVATGRRTASTAGSKKGSGGAGRCLRSTHSLACPVVVRVITGPRPERTQVSLLPSY